MSMRSSSLANNPLAVTRELDGRYDVVLQVRDNLNFIEQVAGVDFATILAELEAAQDFTGITVVQGETVAWDAVNKILTVPKGGQGISIHHLKGTSTTNPNGDFGTSPFKDTYTFYGDANETINLGWFVVSNGFTDGMSAAVYDVNGNGIVDNSERLGGELPSHYVNTANNQNVGGDKTFTGNVTVQGDLIVNGSSVTVNAETVEVEDNLMLINKGEVGNGVTAGEAGILVDRGTAPDYKFVWEEAGQAFKIGEVGSLQKVATREDNPISEGIAIWDSMTSKFNTALDVRVDSLQLNGGVGVAGTISWNIDEGTADLQLPGGSTLQIGQENVRLVRNSTASLITNGTVCMFAGTIGNSGRIKVKPFTGGFNEAMYVYGVATQDIAAGADGLITIEGKVRGIDTTGASVGETWVDEDILYAKPGDNGRLTKVVPDVTELRMPIASVIKAHTNGTLEIRFTPINENQFEPRNANIQTHIASTSNPHGVTKSQVGLGNVDNTADSSKVVASAGKWTTSRNITIGSTLKAVDGSSNVAWTLAEIGAIGPASPALTGVPTAPTAAVNTNTTQLATTAFVNAEIANDAIPRVTSTDNAVVRFDGGTGQVQNSGVIIDDNNNVGIGGAPSAFGGYTTISLDNTSNGGIYNIKVNGTETARLQSYSSIFNIAAKGASTNLTFETNSIERMRIDANGNIGIGVTPSAWLYAAKALDAGSVGGIYGGSVSSGMYHNAYLSDIGVETYKTTGVPAIKMINNPNNNGSVIWATAPAGVAGDVVPFVNILQLQDTGNLLLISGTGALGYGTGSGGTVTQLTSKSTAVTLNKPSGRITTASDALAAGATVAFTLNNNLLNIGDTVVITNTSWGAYDIRVGLVTTGLAVIYVTNTASTPQSQAIPIIFSIIKGAIS